MALQSRPSSRATWLLRLPLLIERERRGLRVCRAGAVLRHEGRLRLDLGGLLERLPAVLRELDLHAAELAGSDHEVSASDRDLPLLGLDRVEARERDRPVTRVDGG